MSEGLENIDKIFKDAFDGFEANVDPSVWTNVQNAIGGASGATDVSPKIDPSTVASSGMKAILGKVAIGVAIVGTVATGGYYIFDTPTTEEGTIAENAILEDAQPVQAEEVAATEIQTTEESNLNDPTESVASQPSIEESSEGKTSSEVVVTKNTDGNEFTSKENVDGDEIPTNNQLNTAEKPTESSSQPKEEEKTPVVEPKVKEPKEEIQEEPKEEKTPSNLPPKEDPKAEPAIVDIIPNVITPNGDGDNDVIRITGENLAKVEVVIMDKTGKPVYRIQSIEDQWNGKDQNGYDLIPGVYYMAGVVLDEEGRTKSIKQTVNLFK